MKRMISVLFVSLLFVLSACKAGVKQTEIIEDKTMHYSSMQSSSSPIASPENDERFKAINSTGVAQKDIEAAKILCSNAVEEYIVAVYGDGEMHYDLYFINNNLVEYLQVKREEIKKYSSKTFRGLEKCDFLSVTISDDGEQCELTVSAEFGLYGGYVGREIRLLVHNVDGYLYIGDWFVPSKDGVDRIIRTERLEKLDFKCWYDQDYFNDLMGKLDEAINDDNAQYYFSEL